MGLFQLFRPLRRRWWIVALVVIPITGLTLIYSLITADRYVGYFTIQEMRASSGDQVNLYPDMPMTSMDVETRMNNLQAMFRTREVIDDAWNVIASSGMWAPLRHMSPNAAALDFMNNRLSTEYARGTDFLEIQIECDSPAEAEFAAKVMQEKFNIYYNKLNTGTLQQQRDFIANQVEEKRRAYDKALARLNDYQTKTGASYTQQEQAQVQQVAALQTVLTDAQRNYNESSRSYASATARLREPAFRQNIVSSTGQQLNPNLQNFIADKAKWENSLAQELMIKGENHPDIISLRQRVKELDDRIKKASIQDKYPVMSKLTIRNPLWETFKQQQTQARINMDVAQKRIALTQAQLGAAEAKLKAMPNMEQQLQKLGMETQIAENDWRMMVQKKNEADVRTAQMAGTAPIRLIQAPTYRPVDKKVRLKTLLAFALSTVLAISLVLLLNQFDTGAYSSVQAEKALGYHVVAALPNIKQARLPKDEEVITPLGASYQMLSTNLMLANGRMQGPALVVSSADSNAGRTTVAANLAVTLARDGARVLLVDADLRQPALHRHFGVENRSGLAEILDGSARVEEVVLPTSIKDLLFIPAGRPPMNPIKLLRSVAMARFIENVSKGTDFIIIDSPSGSTFADISILSQAAKNVILVHEAGAPATDGEAELTERLERLGANIVGVVLNKVRYEDAPGFVNYRRSYEATLALRGEKTPALSGAGRSLTAGPSDDDEA